ncbi:transposase [Bifidobacterium tissieri]|uniref:Transposase n=1 Tax=Bifidobacterium tissieri TaxID=1630162 RepID=A0A261F8S4_9BIFI|nr:transposase [Bifidobacterium tissieri]
MMLEAVRVALDPTPTQERLLVAHAGAARFAFNAGLAHVKAMIDVRGKPEWSLYALRRWWNANKDTLAVDGSGVPWWRENSKEAYNSGLEALSNALRTGRKAAGGDAGAVALASPGSGRRIGQHPGSHTRPAHTV